MNASIIKKFINENTKGVLKFSKILFEYEPTDAEIEDQFEKNGKGFIRINIEAAEQLI